MVNDVGLCNVDNAAIGMCSTSLTRTALNGLLKMVRAMSENLTVAQQTKRLVMQRNNERARQSRHMERQKNASPVLCQHTLRKTTA